MPKQRSKEENRVYMREYMRRRRGTGREVRDLGERRPIVPPPAIYLEPFAQLLGDPPLGRRELLDGLEASP